MDLNIFQILCNHENSIPAVLSVDLTLISGCGILAELLFASFTVKADSEVI